MLGSSSSSSSSSRRSTPMLVVLSVFLVVGLLARNIPSITATSSSSSFPGTIQPLSPGQAEDWWQQPAAQQQQASSLAYSDDDDDDDDESSSDWEDEWVEEDPSPLFTMMMDQHDGQEQLQKQREQSSKDDHQQVDGKIARSSDREAAASSTNTFFPAGASPIVAASPTKTRERDEDVLVEEEATVSASDSIVLEPPPTSGESPPQREYYYPTTTSSSKSSNNKRRPNTNKPLKTLEKLQHMLDETDYLTTSSSRRRRIEFSPNEEDNEDEDNRDNEEDEASGIAEEYDAISGSEEETPNNNSNDALWTSKDRSKYKRQQRRTKLAASAATSTKATASTVPPPPPPPPLPTYPPVFGGEPPQMMVPPNTSLLLPSPPYLPPRSTTTATSSAPMIDQPSTLSSSDVEQDNSDTDDGLGYTLPNLPIYLSDDEGDSATDGSIAGAGSRQGSSTTGAAEAAAAAHDRSQQQSRVDPRMFQGYPPLPPPAWTTSTNTPTATTPPPPSYNNYYPPPTPEQLHQYYMQQQQFAYPAGWAQQQQQQQQQGSATTSNTAYSFHPRPPSQHVPRLLEQGGSFSSISSRYAQRPPNYYPEPQPTTPFLSQQQQHEYYQHQHHLQQTSNLRFEDLPLVEPLKTTTDNASKKKPRSRRQLLRWSVVDATQKLATCIVLATVVCYSSVSPRDLPFLEYNQKFYEILRIASGAILPPLVIGALVVDPTYNPFPRLVRAFYYAFTLGYVVTFALEVAVATVTRLAVFAWWEPNAFQMAPQVPLVIIPWVLREQKYLVKPITLIVQDLLTSAVVCPLMEEWVKLILLQRTIALGKNFRWIRKPSRRNSRKRKWVADPIVPPVSSDTSAIGDEESRECLQQTPGQVVNVNHYVSGMLAVSLGLKLSDSIRRVCMYTKPDDLHKTFYSVCRGLFPIQELCGTVTALGLARRDVLGQKNPLWKLLLPSAIIHGMANFRGKKPIFKWNAATPWSEMQLSPHFRPQDATLTQLAVKAFPKVMWLIILFRVTGYCVKNYYMINRQAIKRTTTYAGKPAAFSAELAAAEMLKSTKKTK